MLKSISDTGNTIKTLDLEIYSCAYLFFFCKVGILCLIQWSQLTPHPFSHSTSWSSPLWETAVWWIGGVGSHLYWWKANIYSVCHLKAPPASACSSAQPIRALKKHSCSYKTDFMSCVFILTKERPKYSYHTKNFHKWKRQFWKTKQNHSGFLTFPAVPSSPCGGNVYLVLSASCIRWNALKNKAINYILFRHTQVWEMPGTYWLNHQLGINTVVS